MRATPRLRRACARRRSIVEELVRYEPKFQEALAALESARISVEDVGATLRDYAGGIQASPERLAEIEERLALLDRLKRKYGPTLEQVIAFGEDIRRKLSEMENKDQVLLELRAMLGRSGGGVSQGRAHAVSRKRSEAGRKLEKLVEAEINDLAMRASFRIAVEENEDEAHWTPSGINQVVYRISTNAGETMRPLEQIASGGELSRVMLALKASVEAGTNSAGHSTGDKEEVGGRAADVGLRRNRYRHRRPRGRGCGEKAEGALQGQSGFVRHAPCRRSRPLPITTT
jgi:DNA repair protein RecN (Recombination protein N)